MSNLVVLVVTVALSVWIYRDAKRLGAHRGALGGGLLDMGPVGWLVACLMIPIVTAPFYLAVARRKLARAQQPAISALWGSGGQVVSPPMGGLAWGPLSAAPAAAPTSAPAAGWYTDPCGEGSNRWWDGNRWTEHHR